MFSLVHGKSTFLKQILIRTCINRCQTNDIKNFNLINYYLYRNLQNLENSHYVKTRINKCILEHNEVRLGIVNRFERTVSKKRIRKPL